MVLASGQKCLSALLGKHFLVLFTRSILNSPITSFLLVSSAASYSCATPEVDLPASIVIAWCLWGIFAHQTSSGFVHWSALAFAIISLLWVIDGVNSFVILSNNPISLPADSDEPPV